jgi:tetratricopeptide (TPR) repeat protein
MADDPNVDAICRTWGGYPLGLVLSAGRVATEKLPLDRLVQHLRRISLPGEAAGYVPPERVQVNELLEDHFQPLTPVEKRVLDGLAAGFGKALTLPLLAAAAGLDELEVETSLGGLVKAALVGVGAGRYTIHDVVREAVIRRLPAGELRRLRLNLAQSLERHLAGRLAFEGRWCVSPPSVWREVEAEFENCLGAIRWSLEAGERRLAWNLFRLVDYPLGSLGYWDEEVAVCQQVIAACGDLDPGQTAWWKALVLGFTHWQRNETQPAEALAEEAGHAFAALDDEPGLADVQLFRANILTYRLMEMPPRSRQRPAGIAEARELFEQAIAVFERRQLTRNLAHALGDYADYWDMLAGRPERALEYCRRSVELYTRFGDEEGLTLAQPSLCDIYINLGRLAEAEAMLPAMRVAVERLGRPEIIPQVDWSEAALRLAQGEAPGTPKRRALKFFRQGLAAATRSRLAYARLNLPYEVRVLQGLERRLRNRLRKLTG